MTYTALSSRGPRIAAASSKDLFHWQRLGLVPFAPYQGIDLSNVDDKDACPVSYTHLDVYKRQYFMRSPAV